MIFYAAFVACPAFLRNHAAPSSTTPLNRHPMRVGLHLAAARSSAAVAKYVFSTFASRAFLLSRAFCKCGTQHPCATSLTKRTLPVLVENRKQAAAFVQLVCLSIWLGMSVYATFIWPFITGFNLRDSSEFASLLGKLGPS